MPSSEHRPRPRKRRGLSGKKSPPRSPAQVSDPFGRVLGTSYGPNAKGNAGEYFRLLIENSTDVVTVVDQAAIIRFESPSVQRILG